jgi:hypothetical protein
LKFESHNKQKAEDKRSKAVGAMMTVKKTRIGAMLPGSVTGSASGQRNRNRMAGYGSNHGYEPQSKLWKQIPQQAAGY